MSAHTPLPNKVIFWDSRWTWIFEGHYSNHFRVLQILKFWSSSVYLIFFFFAICVLHILSKNSFPSAMPWRFITVFPSKGFFFFFLYMTWTGCSASFFCLWISSCPSTVSYNGYYFYQFILIFLSKIKMTINVKVYIWIFSSVPFISMSVLMQVSWSLQLCGEFWNQEICVLKLFLLFVFEVVHVEMWNVKCWNVKMWKYSTWISGLAS